MWWKVAPHWSAAGIGEGPRSLLTAPQSGILKQMLVEPYSIVEAGTPLAVIVPVDVRADFDLLRSYFELARLRAQPSLAEENAMNYERIRVELLKTKSELAIAQVKLEQAERDAARNEPLHREKLVATDIYELSVNTRDALKTEVAEKTRAVAEIEDRLELLRGIGEPPLIPTLPGSGDWLTRLERAHSAAASNLAPVTLVAPITGMVGYPVRQPGEYVLAGEPLLAVSALQSERIIAYLRQPYVVDPEVGMSVRIATRTGNSQTFESQILQVGAQVEIITNSLGYLRQDVPVDSGLPIIVEMPPDARIRPGELVDILIRSRKRASAPSAGTALQPQL
jgi:multidrug resistance efflux pump